MLLMDNEILENIAFHLFLWYIAWYVIFVSYRYDDKLSLIGEKLSKIVMGKIMFCSTL